MVYRSDIPMTGLIKVSGGISSVQRPFGPIMMGLMNKALGVRPMLDPNGIEFAGPRQQRGEVRALGCSISAVSVSPMLLYPSLFYFPRLASTHRQIHSIRTGTNSHVAAARPHPHVRYQR